MSDAAALAKVLGMWLRQKTTAPRCLTQLTKDWISYLEAFDGIRIAVEGDI